eukprot:COSAG02_NODE_5105_length_4624_cov_6.735691_3_plen_33_part_00
MSRIAASKSRSVPIMIALNFAARLTIDEGSES